MFEFKDQRSSSDSPILGGQRAFLAVQKYAVKRFGTNSVETKLVNEKSDVSWVGNMIIWIIKKKLHESILFGR